MTKAQKSSMKPLYEKLAGAGFKKPLVKSLLPGWWDDSIAATESGYQSAAMRLAKLFSLRYSSLIGDGPAEFALSDRCFKKQSNIDLNSLDQASALAFLAARLTVKNYEVPCIPPPPSGASIREAILARGFRWIDFNALVDYCWSIGIPVIHCAGLPSPKMAGVALKSCGRPVIVLTSNRKHGFLAFHLAHELGHIALGHVDQAGWVVDEKIEGTNGTGEDSDIEIQANKFAIELLTGNADTSFRSSYALSGEELAHRSLVHGNDKKIDPMHIALNYAFKIDRMQVGSVAINNIKQILKVDKTDQEICLSSYLRYIDINDLGDEEKTLLKLLGA